MSYEGIKIQQVYFSLFLSLETKNMKTHPVSLLSLTANVRQRLI